MRLEQLLWRRFTSATPDGPLGRKAMRTPQTLEIMAALELRFGTKKSAAAAAGVGRSTWDHVRAGRKPSVATRTRLAAAWRAVLMRHADAFRTYPGIVLLAETKISEDIRTRPLNVGRWTDGGGVRRFDAVQADMVDAWLAGDDDAAVALFAKPVMEGLNLSASDHVFVLDSIDVRFFATQSAADTWARAHPTTRPR